MIKTQIVGTGFEKNAEFNLDVKDVQIKPGQDAIEKEVIRRLYLKEGVKEINSLKDLNSHFPRFTVNL